MNKASKYNVYYQNIFTGEQHLVEIYAYNLEQVITEFRGYFPKHTYKINGIYKEIAHDILFNL